MNVSDIPFFTGTPNYGVDVEWSYLREAIKDYNIDMDPDFQRGHVWTEAQQIAFVEFVLRGGIAPPLQMNNPTISGRSHDDPEQPTLLVDGKQRMTAALRFIDDELLVFGGHRMSEIEGIKKLRRDLRFRVQINDLQTRAEVLRWYIELNSGGVVHTDDEIERVRQLLEAETKGVAA